MEQEDEKTIELPNLNHVLSNTHKQKCSDVCCQPEGVPEIKNPTSSNTNVQRNEYIISN